MRKSVAIVVLLLAFATPAPAAPVLVDADWVAQRLNDAQVVLVDTADAEQYSRFHLPGAVHIPYEALLQRGPRQPFATRLDDAALQRLLSAAGIRREHHIVIYDDVGGLNAGRLFWELERIGHPRVSVLDGGLVRWVLDGRRVVNTPTERQAVAYRADAAAARRNEAGLDDVRRASQTGGALLLDVRSEEEYVGDPRQPRSGHVPGAVWWPWKQAVDDEGGYVRRDPAMLQRRLASVGADPKQPIIVYCRSGHRASQTYLTLRSLGYENVRLYANSMLEYSADPKAALRVGKQP